MTADDDASYHVTWATSQAGEYTSVAERVIAIWGRL
jgi:hypothetical protein